VYVIITAERCDVSHFDCRTRNTCFEKCGKKSRDIIPNYICMYRLGTHELGGFTNDPHTHRYVYNGSAEYVRSKRIESAC